MFLKKNNNPQVTNVLQHCTGRASQFLRWFLQQQVDVFEQQFEYLGNLQIVS